MNRNLFQTQESSILDDETTSKRIEINLKRNKKQDNTEMMDELSNSFNYDDCKNEMWNPEEFSLLYGTPFWDQSTPHQKVLLNQLYWVAYYSQIISAEIATIYFNQTSAAGLYQLEDFRSVCDTLDLESAQERAHINAFKKIAESVEEEVFGRRLFTYPMRSYKDETMIFPKSNGLKAFWKKLQLQSYGLLSSGNAFIACQYFTVRGLRTLNGKIVQHQLSQYYMKHPDKENAPIPSKISYYHFCDESFHFNSSSLIGHEVVNCLKPPTSFESRIANLGISGTAKEHSHFNITVNGIFWYEPALYRTVYEVMTSPHFALSHTEAIQMMDKCFCRENKGIELANRTHKLAKDSYINYLENLDYVTDSNREMKAMSNFTVEKYLKQNAWNLKKFEVGLGR